MNRFRLPAAAAILSGLLVGCASTPQTGRLDQSAWAAQTQLASTASTDHAFGWRDHRFPGKAASTYRPARKAGRDAVAAQADSSASMLRRRVDVPPPALGTLLFSWYVPSLIERAALGTREADDSPVRIVLAFEGDRARFSPRDATLSELSHALTGEPMPYATLMYVWCNDCRAGEVIGHVRTGRIRKIAVESGGGRLNRWIEYERDVRADFERAFGEPPGKLVGIGLMTDADNTRSRAQAWYGPLQLLAPAAVRP